MKKVYETPTVLTQMVCTTSLMTASDMDVSADPGAGEADLLGKERYDEKSGWTDGGLW